MTSIQSSSKNLEEYKKKLKENYKASKKQPKTGYKRELLEFYDYRYNSSLLRANNNHYILNDSVNSYLLNLKNHIAESNPEFDFSSITLTIARYAWPNAFSVGDGTIAVTVSMFEHFEKEEHLAFILCHEFAHYILNHSDRKIIRAYKHRNSDEFKRELKKINNTKYYRLKEIKKLAKANIYSTRKHNRLYEYESDSLGMILFLNAGFELESGLMALDILDILDEQLEMDSVNMFKLLNVDTISYKTSTLFGPTDTEEIDYLDDDKIKTHPDCQDRIEVLQEMNLPSRNSNYFSDRQRFLELKKAMYYETFSTYLNSEYIDKALLRSIQNIRDGKDVAFNSSIVVISLERLITARKNHRTSSLFPKPAKGQSYSQQQLGHILFAHRYKIISRALYNYGLNVFESSLKDKETMISMIHLAHYASMEQVKGGLIKEFNLRFPNMSHRLPQND